MSEVLEAAARVTAELAADHPVVSDTRGVPSPDMAVHPDVEVHPPGPEIHGTTVLPAADATARQGVEPAAKHLPECPFASGFVHHLCICDRLRSAEKRFNAEWLVLMRAAKAGAFVGGLDAARNAVAWLRSENPVSGTVYRREALAAIDALRTKHQIST